MVVLLAASPPPPPTPCGGAGGRSCWIPPVADDHEMLLLPSCWLRATRAGRAAASRLPCSSPDVAARGPSSSGIHGRRLMPSSDIFSRLPPQPGATCLVLA